MDARAEFSRHYVLACSGAVINDIESGCTCCGADILDCDDPAGANADGQIITGHGDISRVTADSAAQTEIIIAVAIEIADLDILVKRLAVDAHKCACVVDGKVKSLVGD